MSFEIIPLSNSSSLTLFGVAKILENHDFPLYYT